MPADFHIHSCYSDGSYTIEEIIERSLEQGLTSIALTDHDTVEGIPEILEKSRNLELVVVPGIELSSVYMNHDIHIIGLGIDHQNEQLLQNLENFREKRRKRLLEIIDCLKEAGIQLSEDDFEEFQTTSSSIGRVHVAMVLKKKGYVGSVSEAFDLWLARKRPCFREKMVVSPFEQIRVIAQASGIPILAHPGDYRFEIPLKEMIDAGLRGIEAFHPDHTEEQTREFLRIAEKYNLLVSGGSDAHGQKAERGYRIGELKLPEFYERKLLEALGITL